MNYIKSRSYDNREEVVQVELGNIIDPTLLRALGLIRDESDVAAYFIDGRTTVPLMIKFKKGASLKEEDIKSKRYG